MANATDLRIVKTLDAIHGSFEELAGKQAFESITVAELCRQARIGKKTFYRHYPALENLAKEYLDVFIGSFLDKTEGCPINRTSAHQYPKVRAPFRCRDIPCSYV